MPKKKKVVQPYRDTIISRLANKYARRHGGFRPLFLQIATEAYDLGVIEGFGLGETRAKEMAATLADYKDNDYTSVIIAGAKK